MCKVYEKRLTTRFWEFLITLLDCMKPVPRIAESSESGQKGTELLFADKT